jgi:hypothetical protein
MLFIGVIGVFLSLSSGCGPHDGGGHGSGGDSVVINEDTLRNHVISIGQAIEYTKAFRALLDTSRRIRPEAVGALNLSYAEEFPADVFFDLLKQNSKQGSAKGIRIYLGKDANGQLRMVLVPVDSLGNDIINHLVDKNGKPAPSTTKAFDGDGGGQAFEAGQQCPTACNTLDNGL